MIQLKRDLSSTGREFYFIDGTRITEDSYTLRETVMIVKMLRDLNVPFEDRTDMNF